MFDYNDEKLKKKRIDFRIPLSLFEEISKEAKKEELTLGAYVRFCLRNRNHETVNAG